MSKHKINWPTATGLVIANMIGTGVFSSLGFQLNAIQHPVAILLLWVLGGLLALFGAFTYAELGTHFQRSGGDYVFISESFHPFWGYLSAWTSMTVGFSAPVAIAALAMEAYLGPFHIPYLREMIVILILFIAWIHSLSIQHSARFQAWTTGFKIAFILGIIGAFLWLGPAESNGLQTEAQWLDDIGSGGFWVALVYVTYAYTGWNAAAYIVAEIDNPRKNLPKALILGTLFVVLVYVALQWVFLGWSPVAALQGKADVALVAIQPHISASALRWVSAGIALQLVATMSSYQWIGPRVIHELAKEYRIWHFLRPQSAQGIPVRAIWFQTAIILLLLLSGTIQQVMIYSTFLLQAMGTLAVVSYLRIPAGPHRFRSPGRPYVQYFFIIFNIFAMGFLFYEKPWESTVGLGILALGAVTYFVSTRQ